MTKRRHVLLSLSSLMVAGCGPVVIVAIGTAGSGGGGVAPPAAPTNLIALPASPSTVELTWSDNAQTEVGFIVESRQAGALDFAQQAQVGVDETRFTVVGLTARTNYEFRVAAVNSGGRSSSGIAGATTPGILLVGEIRPESTTEIPQAPITITGSGFADVKPGSILTVSIANIVVTPDFVDDQRIVVTPPPAVRGARAVGVSNGFESVSVPNALTYFRSPAAFSPNDKRVNVTPVGMSGSQLPVLRCRGRDAYVAWQDDRNHLQNLDIYFNRSDDAGANWLLSDVRINTNDPGASVSRNPRIAIDEDSVYLVWEDNRNGAFEVYFNRSLDKGVTWLGTDVRIDRGPAGTADSIQPDIVASGGRVYVVWQDSRNGTDFIYFNRSTDRGLTWMAEDLSLHDVPPTGSAEKPAIVCQGERVYVAWAQIRNLDLDIFFTRSLDGGASWLANNVRLDSDVPVPGISFDVQLCASDDRVVAVWEDLRNGERDIYASHSIDSGASWATDQRLDDGDPPGASFSTQPRISCDGDRFVVVWSDLRSGLLSPYANRSADAGASWAGDQPISTGPFGAVGFGAVVACSGNDVFAAWVDDRDGPYDIRLNESNDGGSSWRSQDVRLTTNMPGGSLSGQPKLSVDGARVLCCWLDARDGSSAFGIYVNWRVP